MLIEDLGFVIYRFIIVKDVVFMDVYIVLMTPFCIFILISVIVSYLFFYGIGPPSG